MPYQISNSRNLENLREEYKNNSWQNYGMPFLDFDEETTKK